MSGHEFWEDALQPNTSNPIQATQPNTFLDRYSTLRFLCYTIFSIVLPLPCAWPSDPKEDNADVWVDFDKPTFYSARESMVERKERWP